MNLKLDEVGPEIKVLPFDVPSRTGRQYSREAVEAAVLAYQDEIAQGVAFSELGPTFDLRDNPHRSMGYVRLENVAAVCTSLELRSDGLHARFKPTGPRAATLISLAGEGVGVSIAMRALTRFSKDRNVVELVNSIVSFDFINGSD